MTKKNKILLIVLSIIMIIPCFVFNVSANAVMTDDIQNKFYTKLNNYIENNPLYPFDYYIVYSMYNSTNLYLLLYNSYELVNNSDHNYLYFEESFIEYIYVPSTDKWYGGTLRTNGQIIIENYTTPTYNEAEIIFSNSNIVIYDEGGGIFYFFTQTPLTIPKATLSQMTNQAGLQKVLNQIVNLLPYCLPLVIGLVAFLKALQMVYRALRQA